MSRTPAFDAQGRPRSGSVRLEEVFRDITHPQATASLETAGA